MAVSAMNGGSSSMPAAVSAAEGTTLSVASGKKAAAPTRVEAIDINTNARTRRTIYFILSNMWIIVSSSSSEPKGMVIFPLPDDEYVICTLVRKKSDSLSFSR